MARAVRSSALLLLLFVVACGARQTTPSQPAGRPGLAERGLASYYGQQFQGRKTASGERFDNNGMTAAHRTHRFGTRVRVTNEKNGLSVVVRINDRGPFARGRVIDLSRKAAAAIDMIRAGLVPVRVEVIE